jgi:hypothetical protein
VLVGSARECLRHDMQWYLNNERTVKNHHMSGTSSAANASLTSSSEQEVKVRYEYHGKRK